MKVFVFLPDGVGLRNFVFTDFYSIGRDKGVEVVYWNNTPYHFTNHPNIQVARGKSHWMTNILKRTRKEIELKQFYKRFQKRAFKDYHFSMSYKNIKEAFKSSLVAVLMLLFNSENGLNTVRRFIWYFERKSAYYREVSAQLAKERPDLVFCTNQRPLKAIAPVLAAGDLGIPTVSFIFSWDNLPKGTMVIDTDYYFVWSDHMRSELLMYYPHIDTSQIKIVGTPQFEPHFDMNRIMEPSDFFKKYKLDVNKKYICFSGDDITTSPYDEKYLFDLAQAVEELNEEGHNVGIIFRRCPVDFSNRYDAVLEEFSDSIVEIAPDWEKKGLGWNTVMPKDHDFTLLANTIKHCEMVVNLGSSMVFDAACHNTPCAYIRYNPEGTDTKIFDVNRIYKFIHFETMPSVKSVLWVHSKEHWKDVLLKINTDQSETIKHANDWFKVINSRSQHPNEVIWNEILKLN